MGLLQKKKNEYSTSIPLYSLGQNKTLLVIGLGNIGKEYKHNRHNIGFMTVERYKQTHDFSSWIDKKDLRCHISTGMIADTKVILVKPTTLMNLSGEAAQAVQKFYKIDNSQTFVIHDELDIKFGQLRTRVGGGSAGHNGVKSLISHIGSEFGRIRIGIGPKSPSRIDSADFVLQDFPENTHHDLALLEKEVCSIIDELTATGVLNEETRAVII